MLPGVSIVVPTFARTALLVEVLECFNRLTYGGPRELLILNDCPRQRLACPIPGVRCLNLPTFATFGSKINALFGAASHALVLRVDDDDLFLPQTLTALVDKLNAYDAKAGAPVPVARFRKMLQWTGGDSLRIRSSSVQHGALIRKKAWTAAGGLKPMTAGYADTDFWTRMTPSWFSGRWHHEPDGHLLCIHRADAGRPHMEGTPVPPLTERQFQDLQLSRIATGREPSGDIRLMPSWSRDWQAMADAVDAGGKAVVE